MKAGWLVTVLVVCCCAGIAMAQSPAPIPAPAESGQKPQGARASESHKGRGDHGSPQHSLAPANQAVSVETSVVSPNATKEERKPSAADRWIIVFTGVIAFMAICQLGAMLWQAKHMRDQAKIMEGQSSAIAESAAAATESAKAATTSANTAKVALELAERADVLIDKVDISKIYDGHIITADSVITVVLKNFGRTRAEHMTSVCHLTVFGLDEPFTPLHSPSIPMTLGAGAPVSMPFPPAGQRFTPEMIDRINAGQLTLILRVEINYRDVFVGTRDHHTKGSGAFTPNRGAFFIRQLETD